MTIFARSSCGVIAVLLVLCTFKVAAYADSESLSNCSDCNGYSFKAALTPTGGGNYTLSYTITNNNGSAAQNAYALGWSLTLFGRGNVISNANSLSVTESGPGAPFNNFASYYTVQDRKSNHGSNGSCNSRVGRAICVAPSGTLNNTFPVIAPGQSLTFTFNLTCPGCSTLSSWDFLSSGKCVSNTNHNCYAPRAHGTSARVPEPSVLTLLGSELALVIGLLAIFRQNRYRALLRWANLFRLQPRLTS